jgi:RNA polymerase primary sigma factor
MGQAVEEAVLLARHEGVYVCAVRLRDGRFSQHWRDAALSQLRTRFGTAIVVFGDAAWSRAVLSWADHGHPRARGSMRLWPLWRRDIRFVADKLLLLRAFESDFAPRGTLDLSASFIRLGEAGGDEIGVPGAREPAVDPDLLYDRLFAEHPPMSREETRRLLRALADLPVQERIRGKREEYFRLRNRLILGHIRLCASAIAQFGFERKCLSLDRLDLMQEGVFGLTRAIDRFDIGQGTEFSTYAYPWIRQAIGRAIEYKDRLIRIPSHCWRARARLADREWRRFNRILSLSANDRGAAQGLVDPRVDIPPKELLRREGLPAARECIEECLRAVHGRRRDILERRFGLGGYAAQTLQEIADAFGLTRERVRQIEQKALMTIRATPLFERVQELVSDGGRT